MDQVPKQPIKKFPRLTTAAHAKGLAQVLWTAPAVEIRFNKNPASTQFIFTIPVPPEVSERYAPSCRMIFEYFDWETAVREAYDKGTYGGKRLSVYISEGLYEAFIGALRQWLVSVRRLAHESELMKSGMLDELILGEFRERPRRKTGPQPDPVAAWWAAEQFHRLLLQLSRLRRTFRDRDDRAKGRDLIVAIEKLAPWDTVRDALKAIFADQPSIEPRHLLTLELSDHKLVSAILQVELEQKGYSFKQVSFRNHLRFGKNLLKLLSGIPADISTKAVRPR